jgi:hypothetical protein
MTANRLEDKTVEKCMEKCMETEDKTMEKCRHDLNWLIGTKDGVVCRKCGKVFSSLANLKAELDADRAEPQKPVPQEKPKKPRKKKSE